MNSTAKVIIGLTLVVGLGYFAFAKKFSSKLKYNFLGPKMPRVDWDNKSFEMPVTFRIENNNKTAFTVDGTRGNVFYTDSTTSTKITNIERLDKVTIPVGKPTDYTVFIKIPFSMLAMSVWDIINDKTYWRKFVAKGTITVTIGGQTFNIPFSENLQLSQ